jgi:D-glycero-D-manno-heptose 1,7-bisphosphate phosphatase
MSGMGRAAFIDRDGVINQERNYVFRIDDFCVIAGVFEGLAILSRAGYRLIVVTNQAGIARGMYDSDALHLLHEHLRAQCARHGVLLDAIYFCPHHPDGSVIEFAVNCNCRKPAPGMLLQAAKDFDLDLGSCVLIGDKASDIEAAKRAGVGFSVLVESGHKFTAETQALADLVVPDLLAAAIKISEFNAGK